MDGGDFAARRNPSFVLGYLEDRTQMKGFPQLRVRTEFSFRTAFGPLPRVIEALKALQTPVAAIVDESTWGNVRWLEACKEAGIKPALGAELVVEGKDGKVPKCWVLAKDTKAFYNLSTAARKPGANVPKLLKAARGKVVRFSGAALSDPATFDYIDINPTSPVSQMRALDLAKKTGKPIVITSDNYYPALGDKAIFLGMGGRERTTAQHLLSLDELEALLKPVMGAAAFNKAVANTLKAAEGLAAELPTAPIIKVPGDLRKLVEEGRRSRLKRSHLPSWPKAYADRLKREIEAIEEKGYESYFLVVADLIAWAKARMLVGPGRGSSAGSLLCYLVGITEVDPIPHGLLFERFIDLTRKDLPDIDIDFNDNKRELVFEYLAKKYGAANTSRIGNISTLQAKSVIARACEKFAIPDHEKFNVYNVLVNYSSGDARYGKALEDTFLHTDAGKRFAQKYPQAMLMTQLENHASHTSVHAAGVIVGNNPISDYCTVGADGVAHLDKPDAEDLNLLKIDALGLRTLGIMEDAGVVTPAELYNLKLDDPKVFDVFNQKRFSSIFQFEGAAQKQVASEVKVDDFRIIDHLTALARPGPLGGGAATKYVARKAGREEIITTHPRTGEILSDTYGVVLYQEQVMRIVRELGGFSWEDTTVIRKAMSGRKGVEFFNQKGEQFREGAAKLGINWADADAIWNEICNFGAWGMNRAHTCSYAVISYWCAWFKVYHPLEFAAACLRSAKDDSGALAVLREMALEGIEYVPFDPKLSEANWSVQKGKLIGGWMNLDGVGPAKAAKALEDRAAGKLDPKKYEKHKIKFQHLFPLQTEYRDYYRDPERMGIEPGSEILTSDRFPEAGSVLYLAQIVDKRPFDVNEDRRVARRGGKRYNGPTQSIDFMTRDDMGEVIMSRVDRFNWDNMGGPANEVLANGDVLLIRGRRVPGFKMVNVFKMMCLNKKGADAQPLRWAVKKREWSHD